MRCFLIHNRKILLSIIDILLVLSCLWLGDKGLKINIKNDSSITVLISLLAYAIIIIKAIYSVYIIKSEESFYKIKTELKTTKTTINLIEKNLLNIINSIMQKHYSNFEFKDGDNSETRITLYLISENNCYAINRCSTNPTLQKIHGSTHQLNQGCIKWGYERGFHFDNNFPCPSTEPKKYKDYLRRRDKVYQYNFSNSDCKSIRNKCRIYGVQRISKNNKYFGLLVLESHKKHNFTEIKSKNSLNALSNELKDFLELHDLYISQISKETIKTETN